jgi:hypothetical protein
VLWGKSGGLGIDAATWVVITTSLADMRPKPKRPSGRRSRVGWGSLSSDSLASRAP